MWPLHVISQDDLWVWMVQFEPFNDFWKLTVSITQNVEWRTRRACADIAPACLEFEVHKILNIPEWNIYKELTIGVRIELSPSSAFRKLYPRNSSYGSLRSPWTVDQTEGGGILVNIFQQPCI